MSVWAGAVRFRAGYWDSGPGAFPMLALCLPSSFVHRFLIFYNLGVSALEPSSWGGEIYIHVFRKHLTGCLTQRQCSEGGGFYPSHCPADDLALRGLRLPPLHPRRPRPRHGIGVLPGYQPFWMWKEPFASILLFSSGGRWDPLFPGQLLGLCPGPLHPCRL